MPRYLTLLLIPAALVAGAPAAPVPKERAKAPQPYFPTKAGARWVYEVTSPQFGGPSNELVEVVTSVVTEDGAVVVSVAEERDGKLVPVAVVAVSEAGLLRRDVTGKKVGDPCRLLKLPAKRGEGWEQAGLGNGMTKATTRGVEKVEVPAGAFQAVQVDVESAIQATSLRGSAWYAEGVGLVKVEATWAGVDKPAKVQVLKSFTPGKDAK